MATLFETRALGDDLASDDDEAMDLGVGTSTGAGYKGLGGARPLTIAALLENRVVFVAAQHASTADEIPYTPINVKSVVPVSLSQRCKAQELMVVSGRGASQGTPSPPPFLAYLARTISRIN